MKKEKIIIGMVMVLVLSILVIFHKPIIRQIKFMPVRHLIQKEIEFGAYKSVQIQVKDVDNQKYVDIFVKGVSLLNGEETYKRIVDNIQEYSKNTKIQNYTWQIFELLLCVARCA